MFATTKYLSKEVKKSIAYVVSGNFLEYFDLMLMTHLAFVMTPYFMPKGHPFLEKFITMFAFLSSFIIRPLAAVFWGKIGDIFGRVFVLSWTTLIMAVSCIFIVLIPSHEDWGIYSAYCFLFARILQGISSSGEGAAAEIFCTELVKPPTVYRVCVLLKLASNVAGLAALILGMFCVSLSDDGWKYCFYFGGTIAMCAINFRRKLRETKEFLDAHITVQDDRLAQLKERFLKRNFLCLICLNIAAAAGFVFGYGFCTGLLKTIGLTSTHILLNNACIVLVEIFVIAIFGWITYFYYPLNILRWRCIASFFIIPMGFLLLYFEKSHFTIFMAQLAILLPIQGLDPALPIFIKGFHPKKRFTNYGLSWALSKSITYITTGVLATFIETQLGMCGLLVFLLTASAVFLYAINNFVSEEKMLKIMAEPELSSAKQNVRNKKDNQHALVMKSNLQSWIKEW
jgi:MFS transporter, MHS family, proline/betaine transporter